MIKLTAYITPMIIPTSGYFLIITIIIIIQTNVPIIPPLVGPKKNTVVSTSFL